MEVKMEFFTTVGVFTCALIFVGLFVSAPIVIGETKDFIRKIKRCIKNVDQLIECEAELRQRIKVLEKEGKNE
jgi:hypothetical protein